MRTRRKRKESPQGENVAARPWPAEEEQIPLDTEFEKEQVSRETIEAALGPENGLDYEFEYHKIAESTFVRVRN